MHAIGFNVTEIQLGETSNLTNYKNHIYSTDKHIYL